MRFIETLCGLSPDNNSGATELTLFLALVAMAVISSYCYRSYCFSRNK
jgi:hypothetical protein